MTSCVVLLHVYKCVWSLCNRLIDLMILALLHAHALATVT